MANLVVTYWRDIPSQVSVKAGRKEEKRMLSERFQEAIDMAAMRGGASDTDAYLADWRRAEPVAVGDDLAAEADKAKADIEQAYDKERLKALIANGVGTVFGLPGAQLYALFDALQQRSDQIRTVGARHEQACGYMAFGYARSTGRPGVFAVVPGPGILNTSAALCTAHGCCAPVLLQS